jgi:hypothetical protein
MELIAHRGNINGPSSDENSPDLIRSVWALGYSTEIDVWYVNGEFWLGHDGPTYQVSTDFIKSPLNWCHAKNYEALYEMSKLQVSSFFSHDKDDFALTSCGRFWTFPGRPLGENSIAVMPELIQDITTLPKNIFGVCSDYVSRLK